MSKVLQFKKYNYDRSLFITELSGEQQREIYSRSVKYLDNIGCTKEEITECINNIFDSKVRDIFTHDGQFVT